MKWILIERPAPVLNTPNFKEVFGGLDGKTIPLDKDGHPYSNEYVALSGMSFPILRELADSILEIDPINYSTIPLYIDKRFGQVIETRPIHLPTPVPSLETILERMEKRIGTPYVWGGNWAKGIPEMIDFYPPRAPLDPLTQTLWTFRGVDCSGLLYEATEGKTPRNTSQLINLGEPLTINDIRKDLRPLDMIIYPGHVLFVRDTETIIESKSPMGVRICPLVDRMEELLKERTLINMWSPQTDRAHSIIIRRFIQA